MVTNITSLTGNGLRDWLIQRITAVIAGLYFLFLLVWLLCHGHVNYTAWSGLFDHTWMRVFTLLALLSVVCHAWTGIWTITTDYITERMQGPRALYVRLTLQILFFLLLVVYLVWGIQIIWGL